LTDPGNIWILIGRISLPHKRFEIGKRPVMKKVLIIVSISIGGWIGWWLGDHFGLMTAYLLSVVGGAAGLCIGRKIMSDYME
jgi:hypothetical protein